MYPPFIMRRWPAQIRRWTGMVILLVVALFVAAPRGVCVAAVLSDGSCCRVAGGEAVKACCRMGAGCCSEETAPQSGDHGNDGDHGNHGDHRDRAHPLGEKTACPNNSPDELPSPVRHAPDLELQTVVCILPAVVSAGGTEVSRHAAEAEAARSAAPPLRLNCILRI